jgi:uncharacterized protein
LDLETGAVKFRGPLRVKAEVQKITNAVIARVQLNAELSLVCSRCLKEYELKFDKEIKLDYEIEKGEHQVDLDPDIREDIILEYPLKALCKADCRGLCPKCGKNLNEGNCACS